MKLLERLGGSYDAERAGEREGNVETKYNLDERNGGSE